VDETTDSLADWFSNTAQSVGTQVAQSWADAFSRKTNPTPYVPPASKPAGSAINTAALMQNPLAWVLLLMLGFGVYKFAQG